MKNKQPAGDDLVDSIHKVMHGVKPVEHAKKHIEVANKKVADVQANELGKAYDISGDLNKNKPIDPPGEKHEDDTEKDVVETDPTKKISFADYAKNDEIRRSHLRRAKIHYHSKN